MPYALLSFLTIITQIFLAIHWGACVLSLQTTFYDSPMSTWLGRYAGDEGDDHAFTFISVMITHLHV